MRKVFVTVMLALFGAPAFADDKHPLFDAGLDAYEFFCSKCHGKDMVNPGTSSYDLRKFPQDDKERFYSSVKNGRGDMPAWGDVIYPEELDALWVYVATRGGKEPFPEEEQSSRMLDPGTLVADGVLTACLARNAGAVSGLRAQGGTGFDFAVSQAIADNMDLPLAVTWFESEPGEESDPVHETYAMLAYGLCDIVPSHPHYKRASGKPPTDKGALPRWRGMPTEIDPETHRHVDKHLPHVMLEPIAVSEPYMRARIGLAYRQGELEPKGLDDIAPRRLAMQQGTLSGAIVEAQQPGVEIVTYNPGASFLWNVEKGLADVAIVDTAAFDGHRKHNPVSTLALADWRHPIGLDIGVAVLARNPGLLNAVNAAILDLHRKGTLPDLAQAQGLTFNAPAFDGLQDPFTWRMLLAAE